MINDYAKLDDNAYKIYLKGTKHTIVDAETLIKLQKRHCRLYIGDKQGYCHVWFRDTKERFVLHRWIMKPNPQLTVDHTNNKRRDNRKDNLKVITRAENTRLRHSRAG